MTLTLLDLYNTAATQEWAMYDNDAVSDSEFEESLVLGLNKSIMIDKVSPNIFPDVLYTFLLNQSSHL